MADHNDNATHLTVLNMATDLRVQLQRLHELIDEVLEYEQCQPKHCLAQKMVSLVSATTLGQTLALELVYRLSKGDSGEARCQKGCEMHCPWFQGAARVDRWLNLPDFEPQASRLALYDYQRGVMVAVNLADYFEAGLQQEMTADEGENALLQTAFCLSSWLRKLVQLLNLLGAKVTCRDEMPNFCA